LANAFSLLRRLKRLPVAVASPLPPPGDLLDPPLAIDGRLPQQRFEGF